MPFKTNKTAEEKPVFSKTELDAFIKSKRSDTRIEIEEKAESLLADRDVSRKIKKKK